MAIKEYLQRVFPGTAEEFCQKAGEALAAGRRLFVVTANPEILMHAGDSPEIRALLLDEETAVVPDGISVVKAMRLLGLPAKERITGADLVLVALGVPAQEKLIARHLERFSKGVFIGVGGSFDVLSGSKRRAPAVFVKTNTEWLYRILREPSRLGRFYRNNIKFLGQIRREAKR